MALLLAACMPEAYDPPVTRDVSGEWNYSYHVSAGAEDNCSAGGTMLLAQSGTVITGTAQQYTGFCAHLAGGLTSAGLTDSLLSIVAGACTFTAEHNPNKPDSVAGSASCTIPGFTYVGSWRAERVGAPATLVVTPGDREVVAGASHLYQAVLRDAAGRVLNGRVITWVSGNQAVATVTGLAGATNLATVSTLNAGTSSITASTGSLAALSVLTVSSPIFVSVSAGGNFNCALTGAGATWCWGQIDPTSSSQAAAAASPVRIPGPAFGLISVGGSHACGLAAGGVAWCWGNGRNGRLGNGDTLTSMMPRLVDAGPRTFGNISAGSATTCAVQPTPGAYCWGYNLSGAVGNGTTTDSYVPVWAGLPFTSIATWADHTCGTVSDGTAYCWGLNQFGELGAAPTGQPVTTPTQVSAGVGFAKVSPGGIHTCGREGTVTGSGQVYCWGNGTAGTLGDSTLTVSRSTPAPVHGGRAFSFVASNYGNTCALTPGGQAYCWGANVHGQLGDGTQTTRSYPVAVGGGMVFSQISVGAFTACGISAGAVVCWGYNLFGTVGDGTTTSRSLPTRVLGQP